MELNKKLGRPHPRQYLLQLQEVIVQTQPLQQKEYFQEDIVERKTHSETYPTHSPQEGIGSHASGQIKIHPEGRLLRREAILIEPLLVLSRAEADRRPLHQHNQRQHRPCNSQQLHQY